jgi:hypothetical protein
MKTSEFKKGEFRLNGCYRTAKNGCYQPQRDLYKLRKKNLGGTNPDIIF